MSEVLTMAEDKVCRIRLKRPKAIHALTNVICATIPDALKAWHADPAVAGGEEQRI